MDMNQRTYQIFLTIVFLIVLTVTALADEGMWLLESIPQLPLDDLRSQGLRLSPEQLYTPSGNGIAYAVVRVGGGTGSFVSPEGLIITNHHVAFTAIQRQSTPEKDYLTEGFYAPTREEELPAIGYQVYILQSSEDVTSRVLQTIHERMSDLERYQAIENASKEMIREGEASGEVKCEVASMDEGRQYYLLTYIQIRDVRLVYAPPRSIGDFGGEIDNWMWPRHAGDFAFMRAYVAPDGSYADYSAQNVPYHAKTYLKLSPAGSNDGDFVMLLGYPGKTERHESSYAMIKMVEHDYPWDISTRRDLIAILDSASAQDSSVGIRLSSRIKGLNNYLKKNQGMLKGFKRTDILQQKKDEERSLQTVLSRMPELSSRSGDVLPGLDSLFKRYRNLEDKNLIVKWMTSHCEFLSFACTIYKWSLEREKSDQDREPGYQDRDSADARRKLEDAQVNLVPAVDKRILVYFLERALRLPKGQKVRAIERIMEDIADCDKSDILKEYAEDLYRNSKLGLKGERLKMFSLSRQELEKLNDPFIDFAMQLEPERDELQNREKEFSGGLTRLQPKFIMAQAEHTGKELYPDANRTMRFNYGQVEGYSPRDAVYFEPMTTLSGVIQKDTGEEPFDVRPELRSAFADKDFGSYGDSRLGDVPVDFLTTCDVTNGNSGSPVMNGKGELVGLVFDGNYESIVSDFVFEPDLTRTINVDIRYVLFLLDRVYQAEDLLRELTIE
jgi:hypothetical protein